LTEATLVSKRRYLTKNRRRFMSISLVTSV